MNRSDRPNPPRPTEARREVDDLVRTIQSDAEKETGSRSAPRRRGRSPLLWGLLLAAVLANVYVWIGQPAWLVGDRSGIRSVEEAEGLLRFRMYVQAQRIHGYEQEHGAPPERLEQTGEPFEGIEYRRTGPDGWELVGEYRGAQLVLPSTMSIEAFLSGDG